MAAVTFLSDFGAPKSSVTVSIVFPSICHEVMGPDVMILGKEEGKCLDLKFGRGLRAENIGFEPCEER